jgi:hypothetical protein
MSVVILQLFLEQEMAFTNDIKWGATLAAHCIAVVSLLHTSVTADLSNAET